MRIRAKELAGNGVGGKRVRVRGKGVRGSAWGERVRHLLDMSRRPEIDEINQPRPLITAFPRRGACCLVPRRRADGVPVARPIIGAAHLLFPVSIKCCDRGVGGTRGGRRYVS